MIRRLTITIGLLLAPGCWSSSGPEVVVYSALDSEFSEPILNDFGSQTGIAVRPKFDVESTKTVGLVQMLRTEAGRPRCDVFWNNEILNTLRLERWGLLDVYRSPAAASYPAVDRSATGAWHGFAARARILLVNTNLVPEGSRPTSIDDLADPQWRGRVGMAKPLFGTTATHAAVLFATMGTQEAEQFFDRLKQNEIQILSGNKQVAQSVAAGELAFGLTDTDDAMADVDHHRPVVIVYPDRRSDQRGTLFIPNTLAIMKDCPHPSEARRLVDYLLAPAVEERLAEGDSAQIPLNPAVTTPARIETPATVKPMAVDWEAAADAWDTTAAFLRREFGGE